MVKLLVILLIALVFEAAGVVLLSQGLKQIGEVERISVSEVARLVRRGAANTHILLGVLLEAIFFGALLYLMSQADISYIWPLTSLGFVLTALAAKFLLGEEVSKLRWLGVCCIMLGAGLITWSEKVKTKPVPPPVAAPGSAALK